MKAGLWNGIGDCDDSCVSDIHLVRIVRTCRERRPCHNRAVLDDVQPLWTDQCAAKAFCRRVSIWILTSCLPHSATSERTNAVTFPTHSKCGVELSSEGWGCSSVSRTSDRHVADAGSIPRCGKGFFSPGVNFQCKLFYDVRTPLCVTASINTCAHVKDPVVHVRLLLIMETQNTQHAP